MIHRGRLIARCLRISHSKNPWFHICSLRLPGISVSCKSSLSMTFPSNWRFLRLNFAVICGRRKSTEWVKGSLGAACANPHSPHSTSCSCDGFYLFSSFIIVIVKEAKVWKSSIENLDGSRSRRMTSSLLRVGLTRPTPTHARHDRMGEFYEPVKSGISFSSESFRWGGVRISAIFSLRFVSLGSCATSSSGAA